MLDNDGMKHPAEAKHHTAICTHEPSGQEKTRGRETENRYISTAELRPPGWNRQPRSKAKRERKREEPSLTCGLLNVLFSFFFIKKKKKKVIALGMGDSSQLVRSVLCPSNRECEKESTK